MPRFLGEMMKLPFSSIHYRPRIIVSHVDGHFGDAIFLRTVLDCNECSLNFYQNITHIFGNFYKEIDLKFCGILSYGATKPISID